MSSLSLNSVYAPGPNTERGKPTRLTHSPKGDEIVYASGNVIVIRNVADPMIADIFTGHRAKTTVGRIAPSGYYCASADSQGNVMVWDLVNKVEHIVKYQKKSFSNGVLDLDWTEDSKRICVVGDGKDTKAEVWMWDSGSSTGEISGHTSRVQGCAIKQTRPYRLATCGEDMLTNFYKGPPFRFDHSNRDNTRFVNTVEYAPDGSIFATGGGDKKICIYDGVEGTKKCEMSNEDEHKLSIFSIGFSLDGKSLLSCSADKTVKLWDVETQKCVSTMKARETPELCDTPVGCTFTTLGAVVATLRGDLCVYDPRVTDVFTPVKVIRGHNKPIQGLDVVHRPAGSSEASSSATPSGESHEDESSHRVNFVSASIDGQALQFNERAGSLAGEAGYKHEGQPLCAVVATPTTMVTLGMEGNIVFSQTEEAKAAAAAEVKPVKKPFEMPQSLALLSEGEFVVAAAQRKITVWKCSTNEADVAAPICEAPTDYNVTCMASQLSKNIFAVGGSDQFVHFWKFEAEEKKIVEYAKSKGKYAGAVSAVALSSDGAMFAAARDRFICIGKLCDTDVSDLNEQFLLHTSRVAAVAFSPDNTRLLSAGLDCQIFVWDVNDQEKFIKQVGCHAPQGISGAKWLNNTSIITSGADGVIRKWVVA
ncbi:WD repeat-containing protein 1 [Monocercomonoides exilis]|uniref:WD repeat-containing protein 1 n=1 Tax=Monocercomonoides exilis TaxID=2049356 RepID=UPI00355AC740|nr:WD repeat-containing protein 1 [Monocercomonoides exilis]|eukprot:MONOS_12468.1-p1 / transcript=MONOS_12468.1 / gene=MONOS_12468 / organism=Monocercomonoides_exilis_PA203 / gene_product=WD repeat-containing protein 1 / transcript_product=WD repeat-containing protein 1 / location=Mono_scaffold00693:18620-20916(+) / protein_length=648 / sequence_SO=supercontig / SO=protein_coding / is_pseudo=false